MINPHNQCILWLSLSCVMMSHVHANASNRLGQTYAIDNALYAKKLANNLDEERKKRYGFMRDLTIIFDDLGKRVSLSELRNVLEGVKESLGENIVFQIIDSLSNDYNRKNLMLDIFKSDTEEYSTERFEVNNELYANLLASIKMDKHISNDMRSKIFIAIKDRLSRHWSTINSLADIVVSEKKGYVPLDKIQPFLQIVAYIQQQQSDISDIVLKMQKTFDHHFVYQVLEQMENQRTATVLRERLYPGGAPKKTETQKMDAHFYATFIKMLENSEKLSAESLDSIYENIKKHTANLWKEIENISDMKNAQSNNPWGNVSGSAQNSNYPILDQLLKEKTFNMQVVKAQFILDVLENYIKNKNAPMLADSPFGILNDNAESQSHQKLISAIAQTMTDYINKISVQKRRDFNAHQAAEQLQKSVNSVKERVLKVDGPRYIVNIFNKYLSQVKDTKLRESIQSGARVDVARNIASIEQAAPNSRFNLNILYLLVIQKIAEIERKILSGESLNKVSEFKKEIDKLIDRDLPKIFAKQKQALGLLKSFRDTIPAEIQSATDADMVAFALISFVAEFKLDLSIQQRLNGMITPLRAKLGIHEQTAKYYGEKLQAHINHLNHILNNRQPNVTLNVIIGNPVSAQTKQKTGNPKNFEDVIGNLVSQGLKGAFGGG